MDEPRSQVLVDMCCRHRVRAKGSGRELQAPLLGADPELRGGDGDDVDAERARVARAVATEPASEAVLVKSLFLRYSLGILGELWSWLLQLVRPSEDAAEGRGYSVEDLSLGISQGECFGT
jgi:hypothetical protein